MDEFGREKGRLIMNHLLILTKRVGSDSNLIEIVISVIIPIPYLEQGIKIIQHPKTRISSYPLKVRRKKYLYNK